jgi:hypothetical protein
MRLRILMATLIFGTLACKSRNNSTVMSQELTQQNDANSLFNDKHIGDYTGTQGEKKCTLNIKRVGSNTVFTSSVTTEDGNKSYTISVNDSEWMKLSASEKGAFNFRRDIDGGIESIRGNFRDSDEPNPVDLLGVVILDSRRTPMFSTAKQENYTCWKLSKKSAQRVGNSLFNDKHVGDYTGTQGEKECTLNIKRVGPSTVFTSSVTTEDGNKSYTISVNDSEWMKLSASEKGAFNFSRDIDGGIESIRGNFRDSDEPNPVDLLGVVILDSRRTPMFSTAKQENYTCWKMQRSN